jgi:hypothetical protein
LDEATAATHLPAAKDERQSDAEYEHCGDKGRHRLRNQIRVSASTAKAIRKRAEADQSARDSLSLRLAGVMITSGIPPGVIRRFVARPGETPRFRPEDEVRDFGGIDGFGIGVWHRSIMAISDAQRNSNQPRP